jgi:uncharacterized protein (UPF0332 family)
LSNEDEIQILIKRAEIRLEAAELLCINGFYEDSISRAYYSMFYAASALLLKEDVIVRTHSGLISQFGLRFIQNGPIEQKFGRNLRITEELREESEYSLSRKISAKEAEEVLKNSKEFLTRIIKYLEEY